MRYVQATADDLPAIVDLDRKLFSDHDDPAEADRDYREGLASGERAVFLCLADDGRPVAFADAAIRHDYVEGSESSPVGYLEAIYVEPEFRRHGVAKTLERMCERWAAAKGCREMGSDCDLTNVGSQAFHKGAGFKEAERIVAFIKDIELS